MIHYLAARAPHTVLLSPGRAFNELIRRHLMWGEHTFDRSPGSFSLNTEFAQHKFGSSFHGSVEQMAPLFRTTEADLVLRTGNVNGIVHAAYATSWQPDLRELQERVPLILEGYGGLRGQDWVYPATQALLYGLEFYPVDVTEARMFSQLTTDALALLGWFRIETRRSVGQLLHAFTHDQETVQNLLNLHLPASEIDALVTDAGRDQCPIKLARERKIGMKR